MNCIAEGRLFDYYVLPQTQMIAISMFFKVIKHQHGSQYSMWPYSSLSVYKTFGNGLRC